MPTWMVMHLHGVHAQASDLLLLLLAVLTLLLPSTQEPGGFLVPATLLVPGLLPPTHRKALVNSRLSHHHSPVDCVSKASGASTARVMQQPVVLAVYRALSRAVRRLQPQIERHGRSPASLFTEVCGLFHRRPFHALNSLGAASHATLTRWMACYPATQSEISRLGEISPAAKHAILRECKGGEELDGDNQPITRVRPSALIQAMQALFRQPTHLPGWDSPLDCAFAALPLLNNRVALLERCELSRV